MQIKQRNLRVFHAVVDDEKGFLEFLNKNTPLLREFFLLIEGEVSDELLLHVNDSGICYKVINGCSLKLSSIKKETLPVKEDNKIPKQMEFIPEEEKKEDNSKEIQNLKIYNRPIRSGEEIHESTSTTIFGRINSGAKFFCDESLTLYGIIDGFVQCDGDFVVLKGLSPKGVLLFKGELISKDMLEENILQKLSFVDNKIKIEKI